LTLIVIALGGNAFIREGEIGTFEEQYRNISRVTSQIADIIEEGHDVVITHGNGPQVGINLLRYEAAKNIIPPYPLHVADAETQGFLGYIIQQTLKNELVKRGIDREVITVITQVLVDKNDPAFKNPTKPIGPYYTRGQIAKIRKIHPDWKFVYIKGKGYRRVVPSPNPKRVMEIKVIEQLVDNGHVVIAGGGGGIPVMLKNGDLQGVDAVIDKDLVGEIIASALKARLYIILTDVEGVYINYRTNKQQLLRYVSLNEIKKYYEEGHFEEGSMGPKVSAIIRFLLKGGERGIIGHILKLGDVFKGKAGTHIYL